MPRLPIITNELTNIKIYATLHFVASNAKKCNYTDENGGDRSGEQEKSIDAERRASASF